MDIMELGAIGELVGGVAVLVTLTYLARQVRQTNKTASASGFNSLTSLDVTVNSVLLRDRDICELIVRARRGLSALDEVDRFRFALCASTIFRVFDNSYEYERSGLMKEIELRERDLIIRENFGNQGLREYWIANENGYTPTFQAHVNRILEEVAGGSVVA